MEGEGGDRAAEQGRASSSPLKPNTTQVANPYNEATFASTSHHIIAHQNKKNMLQAHHIRALNTNMLQLQFVGSPRT